MELSQLALLAFFPLALLFSRGLSRAFAASVIVLTGSLLLPDLVGIDPPGIPALDKEAFVYLTALLCAVFRRHSPGVDRLLGPEAPIVAMMIVAVAVTVVSNPDPVMSGGVLQDSLGIQDMVSQTLDLLIYVWLPFFVGRTLFRSFDDLRVLLQVLAVAGVGYGLLALLEILIAIPLDTFQFACATLNVCSIPAHRWGTIQPVLFMENVLSLATFLATAGIACAGLRRIGGRVFGRWGARTLFVPIMLSIVACKNVASIFYSGGLAAVVAFVRPKRIRTLAGIMACAVLLYPFLRSQGLLPYDRVIELVGEIDKDRMISLYGRFWEEDYVISHMEGHRWFGWGTIDRVPDAMTFKSVEVEGTTGGDAGIDPYWVIVMGSNGIVGLELHFVLLFLPVLAWWRRPLGGRPEDVMTGCTLALAIAMRGVDLLPNGLWNNLPLFLAGALYGGAYAVAPPPASPPKGEPAIAKARAVRKPLSLAHRLKQRVGHD